MPQLYDQFLEEADGFANRISDMDEALALAITDIDKVARGAIEPKEAREYLLGTMKALRLLISPTPT